MAPAPSCASAPRPGRGSGFRAASAGATSRTPSFPRRCCRDTRRRASRRGGRGAGNPHRR
ncbi:MAG: hypothetical protein FJX74_26450 [Armatimonadetes bacterium]|nr:hypothetical protein [Armatimonadota bacterium]